MLEKTVKKKLLKMSFQFHNKFQIYQKIIEYLNGLELILDKMNYFYSKNHQLILQEHNKNQFHFSEKFQDLKKIIMQLQYNQMEMKKEKKLHQDLKKEVKVLIKLIFLFVIMFLKNGKSYLLFHPEILENQEELNIYLQVTQIMKLILLLHFQVKKKNSFLKLNLQE